MLAGIFLALLLVFILAWFRYKTAAHLIFALAFIFSLVRFIQHITTTTQISL